MANEDITFDVGLNTRSAEKSIQRLEKVGTAAFAGLAAAGASLAAVFSGRQLLAGLRAVTDAAATQEQAVADLNSALRLAGDFSEAASEEFQSFASNLQSVTRIGDETTLQLLSLAKSFGVSNEQAKELVTAAADLAQVSGLSLDSAVRNLGKTFGGLTGELGEVIPQLKELTKEQLQSGAAIEFVTKRFGGAAAAATNTYGGAVDQLSNSFGDLLEEIGQIVTENPKVIASIKGVTEIITQFGKDVDDSTDDLSGFISDGLNDVIRLLPNVLRGFKLLATSVEILANNTPFGQLASLIRRITTSASSGRSVINTLTEAYVKLATSVLKIVDVFLKVPDSIGEFLGFDLSDTIGLEESIKTLEEIDNALDQTGESFSDAVDAIKSESFSLANALDPLIESAEKLVDVFEDGVGPAVKAVGESFDEITSEGPIRGPQIDREDTNILQSNLGDGFSDAPTLAGAGVLQQILASLASFGAGLRTDAEDTRKSIFEAGFDFKQNVTAAAAEFARSLFSTAAGGVGPTQQLLDQQAEANQASAEASSIIERQLKDAADRSREIQQQLAISGLPAEKRLELETELSQLVIREEEQRKKLAEEQTKLKQQELQIAEQQEALQRQGASDVLGAGAGAVTDIFLPGAGDIVGPIITQLSAGGKEAATTFINGLVQQLPSLIDNLVESAPAIVVAIAENADLIIFAIVEAIPAVIVALVSNLDIIIAALVSSTLSIFSELGNSITTFLQDIFIFFRDDAARFLQESIVDGFTDAIQVIKDGIQGFIDDIMPDGGILSGDIAGGGQGLIPDSVPVLGGLATGGLVGGSGRGDTQLFALEPGELVVDRSTSGRLLDFVNRSEQSRNSGTAYNEMVVMVLAQILAALQNPMRVETTAEIDGEALANILLTLNRTDARTSA